MLQPQSCQSKSRIVKRKIIAINMRPTASAYAHLAQRLFNVPLAITPDKLELVMAALADRFGLMQLRRADGDLVIFDGDYESGKPAQERPYEVIEGVAIVPVQGTLVAKLGTLHPYSGMTGYDGIRANLAMALADDAVRAIVLDIDSSGGEVACCFDLVDAIYAARGIKPIRAILTENAFSAAYALASACDSITVPRTGGTGSIGVIVAHVDFSKALTAAGSHEINVNEGERSASTAFALVPAATGASRAALATLRTRANSHDAAFDYALHGTKCHCRNSGSNSACWSCEVPSPCVTGISRRAILTTSCRSASLQRRMFAAASRHA
jgi:capsid assembly protease